MSAEKGPNEKWLKATTTISREQFADIISDEINRALAIAKLTNADEIFELFDKFLPDFTARIAVRVFKDVPEYDEETEEQ